MSAQDTINDINQIFSQYNEKLSNVMPQAVGYNVALFSAISLVTILTFNILRPRNKVIYEPKVKYYEGDKRPPRINEGFFDWVSPVIHTKEPELVERIGLDAVAFLRFLRLMRWMFLLIGGLCCVVLIPLDLTWNKKNVSLDDRNFLSNLTIQNISGWPLYIHVTMSYVISIIVMGFVWWHWREMVRMRLEWFKSEEYNKSFYARTLMISSVPKKIQSDQGLQALLQSIQMPYPTTAVHIGRRVGKLPELIEFHNQTVRELETVLTRYLKGGKIGKKRPTITIGGFLGIGGEKKDAIDYYTTKLQKTEAAVEEWRSKIDLGKVEPYGFASLAAVPYAHIVAARLRGKSAKGTNIDLAPNPKDIIWENLTKGDAALARNRTIGWLVLVAVCFFNTIPLLVIQILANLTALSQYTKFKFLAQWIQQSPTTFSLASGILPPAVSALFGYFLPLIMRRLSKFQGALTRSRLDRAVVARYFAFLIISQLFIFSLLGVAFKSAARLAGLISKNAGASAIFNELQKLPGNIQATYLEESSYWLTFFPLRGFLAVFDLAQLINVIWMGIKTRLFGRTVRDIREWTQPPVFHFAVYYSNMLFMGAVALIYAPLAPLVPISAAIVFLVSSVVYKYQLMFVFVSKVESGGRLWNSVMNRLLFSLVLMQALMILTIGLQMGWRSWYWISAVPPILMVIIFKVFFLRSYVQQYRYWTPGPNDIAASKVHSERADSHGGRLEKRFGHPALHTDLFTPMLHQKMMGLLPQVYHGRLAHDKKALAEYAGQKMEAQIAPGGIRIAGIAEADLAYDLAQYQRDRGQADAETKSIASSSHFGDASTLGGKPAGYDAYMSRGPSKLANEEIEMSSLDHNADQTPLLPPQQGFAGQQRHIPGAMYSQETLMAPTLGYSDAASTHSGVSAGVPVYAADPYAEQYGQRPPAHGYAQHPSEGHYGADPYAHQQPRQQQGYNNGRQW